MAAAVLCVLFLLITSNLGLTSGECVDTFNFQNETQAEGAERFPDITTREDCLELCLEHDECLAVDWNHKTPPYKDTRCWLHLAPFEETIPNVNVEHFSRVPCEDEPPTICEDGDGYTCHGFELKERELTLGDSDVKVLNLTQPLATGTIKEWRVLTRGIPKNLMVGVLRYDKASDSYFQRGSAGIVDVPDEDNTTTILHTLSGSVMSDNRVEAGDIIYVKSKTPLADQGTYYDIGDEETCGSTYSAGEGLAYVTTAEELFRYPEPHCLELSIQILIEESP